MILRTPPKWAESSCGNCEFAPAWQVVDRVQRQPVEGYWLVTQPDHAHLSGRIAAGLDRQRFPWLTPALIDCIGMHDEGWEQFDGAIPRPAKPQFDAQGKPITFVELLPRVSVSAWSASIEKAAKLDRLGAAVVSKHFLWLADYRLRSANDTLEERECLRLFVASEEERQAGLASSVATGHVDEALNVLQFCDLFSLYLCCGASENVGFPQKFGGHPLRLYHREGKLLLQPTPFAGPVMLQCPAFVPNGDGSFSARAIVCEVE